MEISSLVRTYGGADDGDGVGGDGVGGDGVGGDGVGGDGVGGDGVGGLSVVLQTKLDGGSSLKQQTLSRIQS